MSKRYFTRRLTRAAPGGRSPVRAGPLAPREEGGPSGEERLGQGRGVGRAADARGVGRPVLSKLSNRRPSRQKRKAPPAPLPRPLVRDATPPLPQRGPGMPRSTPVPYGADSAFSSESQGECLSARPTAGPNAQSRRRGAPGTGLDPPRGRRALCEGARGPRTDQGALPSPPAGRIGGLRSASRAKGGHGGGGEGAGTGPAPSPEGALPPKSRGHART